MAPVPSRPHPAAHSRTELLAQCDVIRQRRSGPGGQHRNKVETAIRLTHCPTGITAEASERRSQEANLSAAVRRLRINLALQARQPIGVTPSELWRQRCRGGAIRISVEHEEFPSVLAEVLDELAAADWNTAVAIARLQCRSSQLVKLLSKEPRALQFLNEHRQNASLGPLRAPK